MEFAKLIRERYSVRSYKSIPVEEEKLQAVLEAARLAPTAANRQPFRVFVIPTEGRREELGKVCSPDWFAEAPLVLAVVALKDKCWVRKYDQRPYGEVDAAIVMDHMVLAAHDQGLGTCWIGMFHPEAARELLELGEEMDPIAFTPLGYSSDVPGPKKRRPLEALVVDMRGE
ncbi:MAG: nitroreductase [Candidatus Eisenbacteria bacterium]|nr:nitroreductase [Candidatus Eisenbacteria bacterium]